MATRFEMALALLSGRAGRTWAARAARAKAAMAAVYGGQPSRLEQLPLSLGGAGPRVLTPVDPSRPKALEVSQRVIEALVGRRTDELATLLAEEVIVLWPSGTIGLYPRDALVPSLQERPGAPQLIVPSHPKSYTLQELRATLAQGLAGLLDSVLDLRHRLLVTWQLLAPQIPGGRVMMVMAPEEGGDWRAKSLLFGSPDDAHVASLRAPETSTPELGTAGLLIRHLVLGHGGHLAALAHHFTPKVWLGDRLCTAGEVARLVDASPPRLGSTEVVFGETREVDLKRFHSMSPRGLANRVEAGAFEAFGYELDRLAPRLTLTALGLLDPASLKVQPSTQAACLLVRMPEASGGTRVRFAGVFI